jgi:serine/threonine protein kinase
VRTDTDGKARRVDFGDRYAKVMPLGVGGMGEIWEGLDTRLGRRVAIKVVRPGRADDMERLHRRFRREARILARLNHPGIPVLYDYDDRDDEIYMVMELVPDAASLRNLIDEHQDDPLPVAWAAAIGAQICASLAAAHAAGLVHRDLKPANVVLTRAGRAKVLDFGVAAALGGHADFSQITTAGEVPGTALYLAPELFEDETGAGADERSDLYALGCVLYELLTGRRVFESPSAVEEVGRHLSEAPRALDRDDLPRAMEDAVMSLLEKSPADRPDSAVAVFRALLPPAGDPPPLPGFVDRPADDPARLYAMVTARL